MNSCIYVNINKTKKVIAVGWDRRVNLFLDSTGDDYKAETFPEDPWPDDEIKVILSIIGWIHGSTVAQGAFRDIRKTFCV